MVNLLLVQFFEFFVLSFNNFELRVQLLFDGVNFAFLTVVLLNLMIDAGLALFKFVFGGGELAVALVNHLLVFGLELQKFLLRLQSFLLLYHFRLVFSILHQLPCFLSQCNFQYHESYHSSH